MVQTQVLQKVVKIEEMPDYDEDEPVQSLKIKNNAFESIKSVGSDAKIVQTGSKLVKGKKKATNHSETDNSHVYTQKPYNIGNNQVEKTAPKKKVKKAKTSKPTKFDQVFVPANDFKPKKTAAERQESAQEAIQQERDFSGGLVTGGTNTAQQMRQNFEHIASEVDEVMGQVSTIADPKPTTPSEDDDDIEADNQ